MESKVTRAVELMREALKLLDEADEELVAMHLQLALDVATGAKSREIYNFPVADESDCPHTP